MATKTSAPFSVNVFMPTGDPEGLRIISKSNWTGCGVYCPRSILPDSKTRAEFSKTGVYLLVGPSEEGELPILYVGQADSVKERLEEHYAKKDFWTRAIFFVTTDGSLNRAHAQHMEARLITLAKEAKRAVLDNKNAPTPPKLSEADTADAEGFLADVLNILPLLGFSIFEKPDVSDKKHPVLAAKGKGATATGHESTNGFVVHKGSQCALNEAPSTDKSVLSKRKELIEQGILSAEANLLVFTMDYEFSSPSLAAGIVLGRGANGRIEWKDKTGKTLKEIQEAASAAK